MTCFVTPRLAALQCHAVDIESALVDAKQTLGLLTIRREPRNRAAVFGNDDLVAAVCYLVHQLQTLRLELGRLDRPDTDDSVIAHLLKSGGFCCCSRRPHTTVTINCTIEYPLLQLQKFEMANGQKSTQR